MLRRCSFEALRLTFLWLLWSVNSTMLYCTPLLMNMARLDHASKTNIQKIWQQIARTEICTLCLYPSKWTCYIPSIGLHTCLVHCIMEFSYVALHLTVPVLWYKLKLVSLQSCQGTLRTWSSGHIFRKMGSSIWRIFLLPLTKTLKYESHKRNTSCWI